jgi:hypothetical protein
VAVSSLDAGFSGSGIYYFVIMFPRTESTVYVVEPSQRSHFSEYQITIGKPLELGIGCPVARTNEASKFHSQHISAAVTVAPTGDNSPWPIHALRKVNREDRNARSLEEETPVFGIGLTPRFRGHQILTLFKKKMKHKVIIKVPEGNVSNSSDMR